MANRTQILTKPDRSIWLQWWLVFCFSLLLMGINAKLFGQVQPATTEPDLTGIKCLIDSRQNAKSDHAAPYKDGFVYFSSEAARQAFQKQIQRSKQQAQGKLHTKANHQLVLTGQYVQIRCPITGKPVSKLKRIPIAGVKIGLANRNAQHTIKLVSNLSQKAELVFGNRNFKTSFRSIRQRIVMVAEESAPTTTRQ